MWNYYVSNDGFDGAKKMKNSNKTLVKKTRMVPKQSILNNEKIKIGVFSVIGAITVILLSLYFAKFSETSSIQDFGIIFGILVGIVPVTLLQLKEVQRKDSIDRNLPLFLLALVSSVQSGSNLIRAIELAAERNLGSLTPELRNLKANISWGMPMDEAFENFAQRCGTRMARRVTVLIEISIRVGGDVKENLDMIQKHVSDIDEIEKSRKSSLQPYTYTIYIAFTVFLAVSILLSTGFFTEIAAVQESLINNSQGNPSAGMFQSLVGIDIAELNSLLFNMAIIEAVFGGLAAGKIGSGSYIAGIKHVVVMIVITVIAFAFMM